MKLTGKCKTDFEKWFLLSDFRESFSENANLELGEVITKAFYSFPHPMQYGVFVDFFDSVGTFISIDPFLKDDDVLEFYWVFVNDHFARTDSCEEYKTRHEAREQAINKANEIYNRNNKA